MHDSIKSPLVVCIARPGMEDQNLFLSDENQKKYPCNVISFEVDSLKKWEDPHYIKEVQKKICEAADLYHADENRIYITGAGVAAIAVWKMISAYPRLFAAAVPVSGCGDPYSATNAKFLPVWAFHAADDPKISVSGKTQIGDCSYLAGSRHLVQALRNTGSQAVKYTEYHAGVAQKPGDLWCDVWSRTGEQQELWDWMFSQNRKSILEIHYIKPGHFRMEDYLLI